MAPNTFLEGQRRAFKRGAQPFTTADNATQLPQTRYGLGQDVTTTFAANLHATEAHFNKQFNRIEPVDPIRARWMANDPEGPHIRPAQQLGYDHCHATDPRIVTFFGLATSHHDPWGFPKRAPKYSLCGE